MGQIPRKHLLWASIACLLLSFTPAAQATEATLIADAHVSAARPSVNSGSISNLYVGSGYTALVQFDLGSLPASTTAAQVSKATLRLYCNRVDSSGSVTLQAVGSSWGEYSVTFATLPSLGAILQTAQVTQTGAYITFDVTGTVQGWINSPASNSGLALTSAAAAVQFDSKENDLTAHPAALDITLSNQGPTGASGPAGAAGAIGATGTTGAPGPAGAAGPAGLAGPQGPAGGLSYQGTYSASVNYATGAVVTYAGSSYSSLVSSNHGNLPPLYPAYWGLLAAAQNGPTGPSGQQGPQGATGPIGPAGVIGPQGIAGAVGPIGPHGLPGLVYRGAYASTTNYATGDVVLWSGSSYASLIDSNHGSTPDQNPQFWGMLTSQGPAGAQGAQGPQGFAGSQGLPGSVGPPGEQGPQGLQGIAGQAGAQGIPGVTGAQGLQGPMGPQGAAGPVGLTWQSAYSAGTNYGLADAVLYNGSAYVSLIASNHGNTPDQSPSQWSLFAAAGTPGTAGPVGSSGPAGPAGPAGSIGPQGLAGPTGAIGPQGPPVATFAGPYSSTSNYAQNDAASWNGSTYVSLVAGNRGNTPDVNPAYWALLVQHGDVGPAGPAGPQGASGATGVVGPVGATGPQGAPVSFKGPWSVGQSYTLGDAVSYNGSSYIALVANVSHQPDTNPGHWSLLAQAGLAGSTGATGAQGPQGTAGVTGPQGATGPAGATGAAGLTFQGAYNPSTNYSLNEGVSYQGSSYLSLQAGNRGNSPGGSSGWWTLLAQVGSIGAAGPAGPAGAAGAAGAVGPQGPAGPTGATGSPGINFRGSWNSTTYYALNDAVTYAGSAYLAIMSNSNAEPDQFQQVWSVLAQQGSTGPSGPTGTAATLQIGSVTTGSPGSAATITNVGTASAAVLNFSIPQGQTGAAGAGGGSGQSAPTSGVPLVSMYHSVSFSNNYYSLTNPNASTSESSGAVLTWVPAACTATSLTVYSLQSNAITVKLRQGNSPYNLTDTALVCSAVANATSCMQTGSVAVPQGSFLDISISGASGTAAGVWTAVSCN